VAELNPQLKPPEADIKINPNLIYGTNSSLFFCKLTYELKEEDTKIIRGIPQIYNENRNIKQQMAKG